MKIFITGISSGIGRETTKYLIKKGHQVCGIARRKPQLEEISRELHSPNFLFYSCNLTNSQELSNMLVELKNKNFIPDVVILNAALLRKDDLLKDNPRTFTETFDVNFHAPLFFIKSFLEDFKKRGHGHFIAINSTAALRPTPRSISYSASKLSLACAFKKLNTLTLSKNIIFSTVYLGPIDTPLWEGKRLWLVPKPQKVAHHIEKIIHSKKRTSYYPFLSTTLFRLATHIPEPLYTPLSQWILK